MNFVANEKRNGVNHLICLGEGELKDRVVKHLYVQKDGSIGEEQYYTGIEEITETYDYNSTEAAELVEKWNRTIKRADEFQDISRLPSKMISKKNMKSEISLPDKTM